MRCLVTGAAGFIGSHLAERLIREGCEVWGIDCFTDSYSSEIKKGNLSNIFPHRAFHFIEDNLLTMSLSPYLEGVRFVFHQAAQAGVRTSWGHRFEEYTNNNILATQKLLEACLKYPIKRFIYASSSSIYGDADELPVKETTCPKPVSPYGVSKLSAENLCFLYWKKMGLPTVSLRYFTVYGPRQRTDMAFHRFITAIIQDEEIHIYGDGEQTRDFTYIEDIIEANILCMKADINGEVFNIGGGGRISLKGVLDILKDLSKKEIKIVYSQAQKGDVGHTWADIEKARYRLGYSPQVPLIDGLKLHFEYLADL